MAGRGHVVIGEVIMGNDELFDPRWRDDIYDEEVLNIPLVLPQVTKPNNRVWVSKKVIRGEDIFGKYHGFKKARKLTAIVKKVLSNPGRTLKDSEGNIVSEDNPVWDLFNPPKAWMTNSAEELMTMYSAAKEARGEVLVGGLGMGIFPQMALYLNRPVESFTIVDNSSEVIEITSGAWLDGLDGSTRDKIEIIEQAFEDYVVNTDKKFDTIFVDLWEDSDPRYLPFINRLVELLKPLCKEGGRIYIWAYALAVDAFVQLINFYESSRIDIKKIPANIDPLLTRYGEWRALEENGSLSIEEYEKKALEFALTEKLADLHDYNRDLYFFPHAVSFTDRIMIMQVLSLARRDRPGEKKAAAVEPEKEGST